MSDDDTLLRSTLEIAVPMWIECLKEQPWEHLRERAHVCSEIIAHKGDVILFLSERKGETAEAFNRLAEGIACLSFWSGGVKTFGMRFNARKYLGSRFPTHLRVSRTPVRPQIRFPVP